MEPKVFTGTQAPSQTTPSKYSLLYIVNLHTSALTSLSSEQTQQQLEAAQRELQLVMEERDDALLKMTNAQEQARQNATALRNLQAVLEEFQRGTCTCIMTQIWQRYYVLWCVIGMTCSLV